jgi:thioredoxin reductase (NADPH)
MLMRSSGLVETMSRYLIRRIEQNLAIVLSANTEIIALEGGSSSRKSELARPSVRQHRDPRHKARLPHDGAVPNTQWLDGCVALDAKVSSRRDPICRGRIWLPRIGPLTKGPRLLETCLPGVFAIGDVRSGNIKRVASAVGEGSIAVYFVSYIRRCTNRRQTTMAAALALPLTISWNTKKCWPYSRRRPLVLIAIPFDG